MTGNTQRGTASRLRCSKTTVERKVLWLCQNIHHFKKVSAEHIQIDEMESIEHTKLKPLTIPLCVSSDYRILAVKVGTIPAKGHLSEISQKKYGYRENQREKAFRELLLELKENLVMHPMTITTDSHPLYPNLIKEFFPNSKHIQVSSRKKKESQRELIFLKSNKKVFDPLFALNQRCAKMRAQIRRLTRRTWCTTKKAENLKKILDLYQYYNNLDPFAV